MVPDITVNTCNQLARIHASAFLVSTDIQMDVASGSMTIITAKQFITNSLNAMKQLVLDSLVDMLQGTAEYLKILRIHPFRFGMLMFRNLKIL